MKIYKTELSHNAILYFKDEIPSQKLINNASYFLKNNIRDNKLLIKSDNGRTIYRKKLNSRGYYFKKYKYRGIKKSIKKFFRKSYAYRALETSCNLLNNGISVVKPVFSIKLKYNIFEYDSIFVTKEYEGLNLQKFLSENNCNIKLKREILKKCGKIYANIYNNNFINGDPNLPGVLINKKNELALVDVDNIRKSKFLSDKSIIKNIANFNAHSFSGLEKINSENLSNKDRKEFLDSLMDNYDFKVNNKKYLCEEIKKETYKILYKWNKEELMSNN